MPDETLTPTTPALEPAPAQPSPEATQTPTPESKGFERFLGAMEKAASTPEGKSAEPKVAEAPALKVEAKPEPAKPDPKPAPAPQKPEPAAQLRQRLEQLEKSEKAKHSEVEKLTKQIADYEKRQYVTPEMEAANQKREARLAQMEQELAETAYERSEEFKSKYLTPYEQAQESALKTVTENYPVISQDADGNPTRRAATRNDLAKVFNAPPGERNELAESMFGKNAIGVLSEIRDIERMAREGKTALKNQRETYAAKAKAEEEQWRGRQKEYETHRQRLRGEIKEKYQDHFGDVEDQDIAAAWKQGVDFIDQHSDDKFLEKLSVEDRAAAAEAMRYRAAWFNRGLAQINKLTASNKALEEELSKYRKSEPGAERTQGGPPVTAPAEGGLGRESMAERFERLAKV